MPHKLKKKKKSISINITDSSRLCVCVQAASLAGGPLEASSAGRRPTQPWTTVPFSGLAEEGAAYRDDQSHLQLQERDVEI